MLNENKIKMMTKMAIYEKNEGRTMIKTAKYYKGDFIAYGILKTAIATTLGYIMLVIMYALCNLEKLVAEINTLDYASIGRLLIVYYVIIVLIFSIIAFFVYSNQYEKSRKGLKRYFSRLNKLERFYNSQLKRK